MPIKIIHMIKIIFKQLFILLLTKIIHYHNNVLLLIMPSYEVKLNIQNIHYKILKNQLFMIQFILSLIIEIEAIKIYLHQRHI